MFLFSVFLTSSSLSIKKNLNNCFSIILLLSLSKPIISSFVTVWAQSLYDPCSLKTAGRLGLRSGQNNSNKCGMCRLQVELLIISHMKLIRPLCFCRTLKVMASRTGVCDTALKTHLLVSLKCLSYQPHLHHISLW